VIKYDRCAYQCSEINYMNKLAYYTAINQIKFNNKLKLNDSELFPILRDIHNKSLFFCEVQQIMSS